jgi:hypothetical protein
MASMLEIVSIGYLNNAMANQSNFSLAYWGDYSYRKVPVLPLIHDGHHGSRWCERSGAYAMLLVALVALRISMFSGLLVC